MKLVTIALLGILLLGVFPSMMADEKSSDPAGASQVVMAFTGGSAYTDTGGICMFYPLLLGDLSLGSLFAPEAGEPSVNKEHAYLIWVSDFSGVLLPNNGPFYLQLVTAGTATIYFKEVPENRHWNDLTERSSWGIPVAKFVRKAGLFQSLNGGSLGTLTLTAELVSSKPFKLNGKTFNFKDLMPNGMTCFETGMDKPDSSGDYESGTCVAIGDGK